MSRYRLRTTACHYPDVNTRLQLRDGTQEVLSGRRGIEPTHRQDILQHDASDGLMILDSVRELLNGGLIEPLIFVIATTVALRLYVGLTRYFSYSRRLIPLVRRRFRGRPLGYNIVDITIAYALIPPESTALPYYTVEEGDVRCLYEVHSLLTELFGRDNVNATNVRDLEADILARANLVLISGPIWNVPMQRYLGLSGSPLKFDWDGEDLKLVDTQETEYRSTYTDDHRVERCHGLILASRITTAGVDQHLLMVAGCSNLSTYAGAVILSQLNVDRQLRNSLKRSKVHRDSAWAIVFEVENWSTETDAAMIPTMHTGALHISIKHTYREIDFVEPYRFELRSKPGS